MISLFIVCPPFSASQSPISKIKHKCLVHFNYVNYNMHYNLRTNNQYYCLFFFLSYCVVRFIWTSGKERNIQMCEYCLSWNVCRPFSPMPYNFKTKWLISWQNKKSILRWISSKKNNSLVLWQEEDKFLLELQWWHTKKQHSWNWRQHRWLQNCSFYAFFSAGFQLSTQALCIMISLKWHHCL